MSELIPAFARGAVLSQNPTHGSRGAQILAFIEQSGLNGGGRAILKAHGVEQGAHRFALFGTQRPGRSRASDHGHRQRRTECRPAIKGSARTPRASQADSMPTVGANCWTASIKASRSGLA